MKNINSLVVGKTSQLAYYFPKEFEKIESRNIELNSFSDKSYDRVFFCFGEQRTYLKDTPEIFYNINVDYTLKLIDFFKDKCNKIVIYSTSELWNACEGPITLETPKNFNRTHYIESKFNLTSILRDEENKNAFNNVIIIYPFNFNSIYRTFKLENNKYIIREYTGFLFSKIFDSIINRKKIEIGDTYFYRDLVHPRYVVERSIMAEEDELVGSGRLTFVNDFIKQLYACNGLKYKDYVVENYDCNLNVRRNIFYLKSKEIKYDNLLNDTLDDIRLI